MHLFYYFFFQSEVHEVEAANIVKNENLLRTACQKKVCETAIPNDTISHCNTVEPHYNEVGYNKILL